MDGLALIHRACDAGLRLRLDGSVLKITGPKKAEPLVRLLAENKTQVLDALANNGLRELRELREIAPESQPRGLPQSVAEGGRRDREHDDAPYASALVALRAKCPDYVPEDRWSQAVADAPAFTCKWGDQARALGWTARELFGLHTPPERPAATYSCLSRYDETGLIWLLRGRPVIALTETIAAIQGATAVLTYRKLNKPALGPFGNSLDDMGAAT
jgi:hypothetical protein